MSAVPDPRALADLAERAARAAGALLAERFGAPARGVVTKSSLTDLVSDADRDAEAILLAAIAAERPDDAVLAEEGGARPGVAGGVRWVVDPLDGTTNFLWGIPHWCVSVAAVDDDGGGLAGVVYDPCRGECFAAARGAGAALDGEPLAPAGPPPLAEALIATGFNYRRPERVRQAARVAGLLPDVRDIRRLGSAALDLAWVAAGRFDAYYETGLEPWDRAAGALIAAEAGCTVEEVAMEGGPSLTVAARPPLFAGLRARVA